MPTLPLRRMRALPLVALLAALALPAWAVTPLLYNTGVGGSGDALDVGLTDPHYTVTGGGFVDAPAFAVNDAEGYPGYWMRPDALSRWIVPIVSGGAGGNTAVASYTYTTRFDLTGLDPALGSVVGGVAADDQVLAILVNGHDTGFGPAAGYTTWTAFSIASNFVPGVNTLSFVVHNGGGPSGLRVQMVGEFAALPAVPEPASGGLLLAGVAALAGWRRWRPGR